MPIMATCVPLATAWVTAQPDWAAAPYTFHQGLSCLYHGMGTVMILLYSVVGAHKLPLRKSKEGSNSMLMESLMEWRF